MKLHIRIEQDEADYYVADYYVIDDPAVEYLPFNLSISVAAHASIQPSFVLSDSPGPFFLIPPLFRFFSQLIFPVSCIFFFFFIFSFTFPPKPITISTIIAWVKECEKRIDLSEPLASDLYLPAKGKSLYAALSD